MAARRTTHDMARSYADGCAGAHALDLVGERWALLVVRELLFGPKRFTDLRAGLPGISPNVLSQRLQKLEQFAVVKRRKLAPPAGAWVYELTDWGKELEAVMMDLGRWGARSPFRDSCAELSADSLMLSLRTMFDPHAGQGLRARLELRFGTDRFWVEVEHDQLTIARGGAEQPDVTVETDPATFAAVVYQDREPSDAVRSGQMTVHGDQTVLKRFVAQFTLPEQAPQQQ